MSHTTVYAAEFIDELMALCAAMHAFIRPLRRDDTQAIIDYFTDKCKELGIEVDE